MSINRDVVACASPSGVLTIDSHALARNYQTLCRQAPGAKVAAVVKADGYGLGAERVAKTLRREGCRHFFVAHLGEALRLRAAFAAEVEVFVLNGLQPGAEPAAVSAGVIPVLNSLEQVGLWERAAREQRRILPAVLQFDTGMSRLGLAQAEHEQFVGNADAHAHLDIRFIMSHLASADDPSSTQSADQLAAMKAIARYYPGIPICLANSAGAFLAEAFHGALVRPGIALYGGAPTMNTPNPMEPVVSLDVAVIQTRTVPAGAKVGYGASFVSEGSMRLATLAAGYADGLPRCLGNRGSAYFEGERLPFVGRVSMDSLTVDISALPEDALQLGSLVEIIGPNQTLEAIAADAGTISYEILTSLGTRYHRVWL